jgi:L-ascorbate metabolism protein UlaG (beta-lactamase superfamily)
MDKRGVWKMSLKNIEERKDIAEVKGQRRTKFLKRTIKVLSRVFIIVVLIAIGGYIFMHQPQFGKAPAGERLERIKSSPNYKNGKFQNLETGALAKDFKVFQVLKEKYFDKSKRLEPDADLPTVKTDLKNLEPDENIMIWLGHSSYFLQIDGKKILIDPVLSGNAAPVKFSTRSYKGSDIYTAEDFPDIDYLLISHDHFDHLDYKTVTELKPKVKKVIAGLGVGAHFERWGYAAANIIEGDWYETVLSEDGFEFTLTPARHRSGRGLVSNQTLWVSFAIKTPNMKVFYSGDSGYGTHFADIGNTFGPFDLALMECGQYSQYWKYSHMAPEEVVQATIDLKAKKFIPGHWSKFTLSLHDWDEPITKVIEESIKKNVPVIYPMIGDKVNVNEDGIYEAWWEKVQ